MTEAVPIQKDDRFEKAVLDAVRKWRFKPGRCGDKAVTAKFDVEVNFRRY